MTLPKSHLKSLEVHLRVHEERLALLHTGQDAVRREIERREAKGYEPDPDEFPKEDAVSGLAYQLELIEREIGVHETILALARDERALDALGEVAENPELAREAARDPRAFARERGVDLPRNVSVNLDVSEGDEVALRVFYYDDLSPVDLTWDRTGFSVPELRRASAG